VSTKPHFRLSPASVVLRATVLAAVAAGFFAVTGGQALASHVTCGDTITTDTTLDRDLVDCPDKGIVIGADGITLNLRHHTVDGDGALTEGCNTCDAGIDNSAGHDGVTIRGGSVREFAVGVVVREARGNRVRDLSASRNEFDGIMVRDSADSRVERSSANRQ
jgi:parallel beta-helix repeat protein